MLSEMPEERTSQGSLDLLECGYEIWLLHQMREAKFAIRDYYEANKEQILAEVKKCGETPTRKRWGIPNSSWVGLKKRWDLPLLKRGGDNRGRKPREGKTTSQETGAKVDGKPPLPPFPPWDDGWNDGVKKTWLTAYAEMGRS